MFWFIIRCLFNLIFGFGPRLSALFQLSPAMKPSSPWFIDLNLIILALFLVKLCWAIITFNLSPHLVICHLIWYYLIEYQTLYQDYSKFIICSHLISLPVWALFFFVKSNFKRRLCCLLGQIGYLYGETSFSWRKVLRENR